VEYNPSEIEQKWQKAWSENGTYRTESETSGKPKYYVLDMFPYPSGAGLHVGHPLGYIASDIVARFKRAKGFNVLHPMGFDAFGLPAEQYAIETGQHPAKTTTENIARYVGQLQKIGFSFDWEREVRTSEPDYYKWTQFIFLQLFEAWFDKAANKAKPISELILILESKGNANLSAATDEDCPTFSASEWNSFSEVRKAEILLMYRLAYVAETFVNWCPGLGTVLANDEVKDGFSERGGFPVEKKKMLQWSLRISAYAERLLQGLETLDWSDAVKEMQRNWIGKSQGASVWFQLEGHEEKIEVFTTRIDTIFGATFMSLAPEHPLVDQISTAEQRSEIEAYKKAAASRSERERMADVKTISGTFTGAYATNPFSGKKIPVWIADYVLAGYGTGAVMAVPCSDTRDYAFAKHFKLPIIPVQEGAHTDISADDFDAKAGTMVNSEFLNGMPVKEAMGKAISWAEENGVGKGKTNYRMRDAIFGRQRYWGEPVPVYYENGIPKPLKQDELPLLLPEIDRFLPTETGEPPLGRAKDWKYQNNLSYELSTMPGWAGSSWYFLRYMDPKNKLEPFSKTAEEYWQQVDLYIGGTEHATGHLLYSRFWHKFLHDMGFVSTEEPFKKLVNQGMIQGRSSVVFRLAGEKKFVSKGLINGREVSQLYVDVNLVKNDILDIEGFRKWRTDFADAEFELEKGEYHCGYEVEKMSKSKYNVVSPDDICAEYGADTLRLYEMFLGPLEQSKPWNTNGIEGVYRFLKKLWNLFAIENGQANFVDEEPTKEALKVLHKTIKKGGEDINSLSLNTSVSAFMVCVNELSAMKCRNKAILTELLKLVAPFAPHISEELWHLSKMPGSVTNSSYPDFKPELLVDDEILYPISVNGKVRAQVSFPADMPGADIEKHILAMEIVQKWLEGKAPKKVIVVPKKIVNVVI